MNLPEPVISEQHVKIYESIPKMQTNFIGQKDDKIIIRGYLNFLNKKVDKKTKKWKNLYFVLNGTEQHLYYFENTKRSKPKGLIDLSYAALYPVHDSFFDRSNCFQVVVKALNHQEVYYFCAESQGKGGRKKRRGNERRNWKRKGTGGKRITSILKFFSMLR